MVDDCCDPVMDLSETGPRRRRILIIVLAVNVCTFVLMGLASWQSGAASLLSGALDNLGDATTYAISLAVLGASVRTKARVAMLKGILILGAGAAVAVRIAWGVVHPGVPVFGTFGLAALVNLAANGLCLWLLTPYRRSDINMESAWECSRNDLYEGAAVLAAAGGVFLFKAGWPDLLVAVVLLGMFVWSGVRVVRDARTALRTGHHHHPHKSNGSEHHGHL